MTRTTIFLALCAAAMACSNEDPGRSGKAQPGGTGALLSVDYFGDTDVIGFHAMIERVDCGDGEAFEPWSFEGDIDLVDGVFPAMIDLVAQHLDPASRHLGADLFITLEPGCYDIEMIPVSAFGDGTEESGDWMPSADCSVASATGVEVTSGLTTETMLFSQCVGDSNGAMDTLVILNHPPEITVEIDEKFNYECEPVEVCLTVHDPDDDPIEIEWANMGDTEEFSLTEGDLELVGFEDGHRVWEQCTEIVTQWVDSYDFMVTAYDMGWQDGELVRMETLVAPEESHVSLTFPIHTNWIEEPMCFDDDGDLVEATGVDIERAAGCAYITAEQYYCNEWNRYGLDLDLRAVLCDGTDLIEENLYPECPDM